VDPSAMLTQVQLRILRGEPGEWADGTSAHLALPSTSPLLVHVATSSPIALPPRMTDFVGRANELAAIDTRLDGPGGLALLSGPPGIGKTALAVEAAYRFADRFSDGQFIVSGALSQGGSDGTLCAKVDELRQRRCVIVLDGVTDLDALTAAVAPMSTCCLIVTSNPSLLELAVTGGAWLHRLVPLGPAEAVATLRQHLGDERWDAESAALTELAAWCGGHPGALRLVAARLLARPRLLIAEYLRSLEDEPARALACGSGNQFPGADLHGYLDQLDPPMASAFLTLVASAASSFDLAEAADVLGIQQAHAAALLDDLVVANLVEEEHQGDFTVHRLLRYIGRSLAAANDTRMDVIR
jgi:hypothetical protein